MTITVLLLFCSLLCKDMQQSDKFLVFVVFLNYYYCYFVCICYFWVPLAEWYEKKRCSDSDIVCNNLLHFTVVICIIMLIFLSFSFSCMKSIITSTTKIQKTKYARKNYDENHELYETFWAHIVSFFISKRSVHCTTKKCHANVQCLT